MARFTQERIETSKREFDTNLLTLRLIDRHARSNTASTALISRPIRYAWIRTTTSASWVRASTCPHSAFIRRASRDSPRTTTTGEWPAGAWISTATRTLGWTGIGDRRPEPSLPGRRAWGWAQMYLWGPQTRFRPREVKWTIPGKRTVLLRSYRRMNSISFWTGIICPSEILKAIFGF